jgi:hypothetical protein
MHRLSAGFGTVLCTPKSEHPMKPHTGKRDRCTILARLVFVLNGVFVSLWALATLAPELFPRA